MTVVSQLLFFKSVVHRRSDKIACYSNDRRIIIVLQVPTYFVPILIRDSISAFLSSSFWGLESIIIFY